jgi:hypothetical protein
MIASNEFETQEVEREFQSELSEEALLLALDIAIQAIVFDLPY